MNTTKHVCLEELQRVACEVIEAAGGSGALADKLEIPQPNVSNWKKRGIPYRQCQAIEALFDGGFTCHYMRPDVFPAPKVASSA